VQLNCTFLFGGLPQAAWDIKTWCSYGDEDSSHRFCARRCCLLALARRDRRVLFHALPVSGRESVIIGALFFVGAAILMFIRPSHDRGP
jgi:hypothetical protein